MKEKLRANARLLLLTGLILSNCAVALAYYHPEEGRFLSRDPIEEAGGWNLYGFIDNNPVNFIDPYGLWHSGDHRNMTIGAWDAVTMAAEEMAYRGNMADVLVRENARVDGDWLNDNAWHFNRGLTEDIAAARNAYANKLRSNQTDIQNALATPNKASCERALKVMGNLSHAYQDYYAHAILISSDGSAGTIGRVTGNPGAPGADMKPASWGSLWPPRFGEHGRNEPGERAPDTASRKSQSQTYTRMEFQVFSANWWHACKCYAKEIFGH